MFLIQGAVVSSYTVVELYVRPGETVTVPCDCKLSSGETIIWYRNCSHENQPPLILTWQELEENKDSKLSNLNGMWNHSSKTYTLLITNISDSHLGLYYCRTEKKYVTEQDQNHTKYEHRYGNVTTRISFGKLTLHRFLFQCQLEGNSFMLQHFFLLKLIRNYGANEVT